MRDRKDTGREEIRRQLKKETTKIRIHRPMPMIGTKKG